MVRSIFYASSSFPGIFSGSLYGTYMENLDPNVTCAVRPVVSINLNAKSLDTISTTGETRETAFKLK